MRAVRLVSAAFAAAMVGALVAAFAPLGRTCTDLPGGASRCWGTSTFSANGWWVVVVVSVPVVLSMIPVLVRSRSARIASAVLLWVFCVLGMLSIGLFFVPAAALMTAAAAQRDPRPIGAG